MVRFGDTLGGRYVVQGLLGSGGTARVYLCKNTLDESRLAVKEIPAQRAEQAGMLAELRLKEKLHHPALPHFLEAWEEDGCVYVAMDYVEGVPLDELLHKHGAFSEEQAVEWTKQLCKALVYLHGFSPPVIYRDMKPANVILQADGRVKLVDFGAIRQRKKKWEHDTRPLGTPGYAAPEQYGKHPRSDERSDVYGLGVTLYYLLTGHDPGEPPYRICDVREWNKRLSPRLSKIVKKCTAKWPAWRYQTCEELLRALESYR